MSAAKTNATAATSFSAQSGATAVQQKLSVVDLGESDDDDDSPLSDLEELGKQVDYERKMSENAIGGASEVVEHEDAVSAPGSYAV